MPITDGVADFRNSTIRDQRGGRGYPLPRGVALRAPARRKLRVTRSRPMPRARRVPPPALRAHPAGYAIGCALSPPRCGSADARTCRSAHDAGLKPLSRAASLLRLPPPHCRRLRHRTMRSASHRVRADWAGSSSGSESTAPMRQSIAMQRDCRDGTAGVLGMHRAHNAHPGCVLVRPAACPSWAVGGAPQTPNEKQASSVLRGVPLCRSRPGQHGLTVSSSGKEYPHYVRFHLQVPHLPGRPDGCD